MTENEIIRTLQNFKHIIGALAVELDESFGECIRENFDCPEDENVFEWLNNWCDEKCIKDLLTSQTSTGGMTTARDIAKRIGLSDNTKIEDLKVKHEAFEIN